MRRDKSVTNPDVTPQNTRQFIGSETGLKTGKVVSNNLKCQFHSFSCFKSVTNRLCHTLNRNEFPSVFVTGVTRRDRRGFVTRLPLLDWRKTANFLSCRHDTVSCVTKRDKQSGIAAVSVTDVTDPLGAVRHVTLAATVTTTRTKRNTDNAMLSHTGCQHGVVTLRGSFPVPGHAGARSPRLLAVFGV